MTVTEERWYTLELEVRPEHLEEFLVTMKAIVAASRTEDGVLQYDLLRDRAADNRFNLVQRYASPQAVSQHMAAPHSQEGLARVAQWLVNPFVQTDYSYVDGDSPQT
ncbi:putative quinol monooxygenase [Streptomyces sp. NPDC002730]|uniref:putative quinol monooxygenase n=1 Tax=Streptomyces sp. NPDC002730 TaxID=3364662 RepID=UPI0036B2712A